MAENRPSAPKSQDISGKEGGVTLLDIPLRIRVELGRRTMKVREILELKKGSILDLPRSAGESIDVYVSDKLVGYGEVIEMETNTGLRITDLASQP